MNYVPNFNFFGVEAQQLPCTPCDEIPGSSTEGAVGCLRMHRSTGDIYKCVAASNGEYTWVKDGGDCADISTAIAEAITDIMYEEKTIVGDNAWTDEIAEFTLDSKCLYSLIVNPFMVHSAASPNNIIYEIYEHYADGSSKRIVSLPRATYDGKVHQYTIDNSSGDIQKIEVKLRLNPNTETTVLLGKANSGVIKNHNRLNGVEGDINLLMPYFFYSKFTSDYSSKPINTTYTTMGTVFLNNPIRSGQTVIFKIEAPGDDQNYAYFNLYNGATRVASTVVGGTGSRTVKYTNTLEQDINALELVVRELLQQNIYTVTVYDDKSVPEMVNELSASVDALSSGAVKIPKYYESHLSEAISKVETNMLNAGVDGETFVLISDLHWEGNAKNSPALISVITNELPIENIMFCGDAFNGGVYEDKVADMNDIRKRFSNASKRFLSIFGNHDSNHLDGGTGFENREFYTLLQKQNDYLCSFDNPSDNYCFYFDNPTTKTRMLFLDTGMTNPTNPDAQLTWVQNAVNSAPSGYNILAFAHVIYVPVSGGSYGDPTTWEMTSFMTDVCEFLDTVTDKNVKGIFGGHTHMDYASKTTGGIPIIIIDCDARQSTSSNSQTLGTINEQAFDIVTVNYNTNTVHCVRVGRGTDRTIQ